MLRCQARAAFSSAPAPQMQLQYARLVDAHRFHYVPLKSARSTRDCALCPTTIRAATAAGDMPFYAAGGRLTGALTAVGLCTAWDATEACCINENAGRNGGDTGFIRTVINTVSSSVAVDSKARVPSCETARKLTATVQRIYVVGIANGGFLAARLACEMPQLFAGILVYAAGFDAAQCTSTQNARVPLLLMHGDADVIVPFAGGVNSAGVAFPGFTASAASWTTRNQCTGSASQNSFNVSGGGSRDDKYTVRATDYSGCVGGSTVAAWRIERGQHFAMQATSTVLFGKALDWLMSR